MRIKGFTPVFDSLVSKYNQSVAVTYGKIWRYCMWSDMSRCTASNARLAKETGYDEKTIRRAKEILAKDELIERHYSVGKTDVCYVKHELALEIQGPDIVSTDLGHDVHATPDIVSDKDSTIDSTQDIKQKYADAMDRGAKLSSAIQADFQKHLGLSPTWETKTNQQYYQFFRERYVEGQTAEMFAAWWRSDDFRAKQNISLFKVKEQWYQAFMVKSTNDLEAENQRLKELHG